MQRKDVIMECTNATMDASREAESWLSALIDCKRLWHSSAVARMVKDVAVTENRNKASAFSAVTLLIVSR